MDFVNGADVAAYLDVQTTPNIDFKARLANDIVVELLWPDPLSPPTRIPTRVRSITLEVAARAIRNPDGFSSETIDDYTYRRTETTREAGVYLTDTETTELLSLVGRNTAPSLTVRVRSGADVR